MELYKVGQVIEKFKNHSEGVVFDLDDAGATLLVFFANPKEEEIEQFKTGKNFEIRFTELYKVIMMTVKIGNLNWMDAPYSPHLSKNLTKFELPRENEGLGLTIMFIDAATGEIKYIRLLGLSEHFTKKLFGTVMEQKMSDFNKAEYANNINRIFRAYSTDDIVKMSKDYCRLDS